MMHILYNIIFILFAIGYLPVFILKGKYKEGFAQRLGFLRDTRHETRDTKRPIWIHAVSVGEAMVASMVKDVLRKKLPDARFVVSTTTQTGQAIAKKFASSEDTVIYSPLDASWITGKFMRAINPGLLVLTETEIWPNLITAAHRQKVPIALINGRISPRSFNGYRAVRFFIKPLLNKINLFCMRTQADAERIISLGAAPDKVQVTGNVKFDAPNVANHVPPTRWDQIPPRRWDMVKGEGDILIVAGSTHNPEEKILLGAYKGLLKNHPNLKLLIAPRHIERAGKIKQLVETQGLSPEQVSVLDVMGELKNAYSAADIVFVGGSLIPHGGQNPIEPASLGKPIMYGPHMFNFQDVSDMLTGNGAAIVSNEENLQRNLEDLIKDIGKRQSMGEKAKYLIEKNRGASERVAECLKNIFTV